jgi:S1-C subfamily serine protease
MCFASIALGCSEGDRLEGLAAPASTTTAAPLDPAAGPCAEVASTGALDATALLGCLGPSLAFVETPMATGSAILIADGFLVTNAHVVDPFGTVSITFDGGEVHEEVPVVGADLRADIAVVGPVDTTRPAVPISDAADLVDGGPVYLIGYPGETDMDAPTPAISQGIVSRRREAKPFGLQYVQTDAAIGGGQSGGALVDDKGHAVGVSGLRFAEEYALALSGEDVRTAIEAVQAGTSTPYHPLPVDGMVTTTPFHVEDPEVDEGIALLPTSTSDATVRVSLRSDTAQPTLAIIDVFTGEPRFYSQSLIDQIAAASGATPEDIAVGLDAGREVEPNVFDIDVPADAHYGVSFGSLTGPADVVLDAPNGVFAVIDDDAHRPVVVGDDIDGAIDYLEPYDSFVVDLAEGQELSVFVGSASGDMAITIQAPGQSVYEAAYFDDSGVGMLSYDVDETYTADVAGRYVLYVSANDGIATGYRLQLRASDG